MNHKSSPEKNQRAHLFYQGGVQGVGFRYSVKEMAAGYEVVGTVKNLPDGRVELVAEGTPSELRAFLDGIRNSGLAGHIHQVEEAWGEAQGGLRGFQIVMPARVL